MVHFTEVNGVDYCLAIFGMCNGSYYESYRCRLLLSHVSDVWPRVTIEWIRRNILDVGGSSTGSEGMQKLLKRQKGEGIETMNSYMRCRRTAMT